MKNQITIVALDDDTVKRYGRWPVPRQAYVDLLNALKPFNTRAVAFDVAFYDPSDRPEQDRAFAAAIKDLGNVYLALQGVGVASTPTRRSASRRCSSRWTCSARRRRASARST